MAKKQEEVKDEAEGSVLSPDAAAVAHEPVSQPIPIPDKTKPGPMSNLETIARECLAGTWGHGQARRDRLAKAGHDHRAVTKEMVRIVNSANS